MNAARVGLAAAILSACWLTGAAAQDQAADSPRVYFINLEDGATVQSPFLVQFGLSGMGVSPAGNQIENTGHHHLLVDAGMPPMNEPIPSDENHRHFGGGQTEVTLDLPPGQHTLQLLLGDWSHIPHTPVVTSDRITITVTQ